MNGEAGHMSLEGLTLVKRGKTKDVYKSPDDNTVVLVFKDDATGKDGVFDPGENQVGLTIQGMGVSSLRMSGFFFQRIGQLGIPTHMVSFDESENTMTVLPAQLFSHGLECVCRCVATGSFIRRYGLYAREGQILHHLFEVTVKDDDRGDPLITEDSLVELGILKAGEYGVLRDYTQRITGLIAGILLQKGIVLYDIKYEFGKHDNKIVLIDEISAGSMRCYKDGVQLDPITLAKLILAG